MTIEQALDMIQVEPTIDWEPLYLLPWGVTHAELGVLATFQHESEANAYRLFVVNRMLNPLFTN